MIQNLKSIYPYFIFASIVIILLSIILFFITRKYNKKTEKILSVFATLKRKNIILISCVILNFMLVAYFSIAIRYYSEFVVYIIIINTLISMIVSLDFHIIISNIIYSAISIFSLKIINLVYVYLSTIYYDRMTFILGSGFVLMIMVYEIFISFRQIELLLKKSKVIGDNKNGRKVRK